MTEEVQVGMLVFQQDEDPEGHHTVVVHKSSDLEGWITFTPCPDSQVEWVNLRNNCYPLNGRSGEPPLGTWIIYEYIGREGCSINLHPDLSENGFTENEIRTIAAAVNLMFPMPSRIRLESTQEAMRAMKITH